MCLVWRLWRRLNHAHTFHALTISFRQALSLCLWLKHQQKPEARSPVLDQPHHQSPVFLHAGIELYLLGWPNVKVTMSGHLHCDVSRIFSSTTLLCAQPRYQKLHKSLPSVQYRNPCSVFDSYSSILPSII